MAYGVFSHDVTTAMLVSQNKEMAAMLVSQNKEMAAMLVSQNKEMVAMLVSQTKPLGIELYFYAKTFFCFSKPIWPVVTWTKTLYWGHYKSVK